MKKRRKRGSKLSSRTNSLGSMDTAALLQEIQRRRKSLESQRSVLEAQLATVDSGLAGLGTLGGRDPVGFRHGRPKKAETLARKRADGKGRGRGGNKKSLVSLLHGILQGRTMGMDEMMKAAKNAGHKSKSKNFRTIVSLALLNNRKMFKRVSRGQYTAK